MLRVSLQVSGILGILGILGISLMSCSSSHDGNHGGNTPTKFEPAISCDALASKLSIANAAIESVALDAGGVIDSRYPDAGLKPENCVVTGIIGAYTSTYVNPDTGSNEYGTRFELRLPTEWNGRFYFQGGGGNDGVLVPADGQVPGETPQFGTSHGTPALWRGFAVVSSDGGHHSGDALDAFLKGGFGIDPSARIAYGYASIGQVTPTAKQIINTYYGHNPTHSYFLGCSKGGQEAMQAALKYSDQFDGIVAGDPGFRLPHAALAHPWIVQALAPVALAIQPTDLDVNGDPLLYNAFSSADLELIRGGIVRACDAMDGISDGIIFNVNACAGAFDPTELQCPSGKDETCLSIDQITAIRNIFDGVKASDGTPLYASFPYDAGISSFAGWPLVYLGIQPGYNSALMVLIGQASGSYIFNTPPDPQFSVFDADPDQYAQSIVATSEDYAVSSVDFMEADSVDLDAFKSRGGKAIYFHGVSDPIFSANDTIDYYRKLLAAYGDATIDFARLFLVPGMNHCAGGDYATDSFDSLDAIVNWVENGTAPDAMLAKPLDAASTKLAGGTTRPLCAYPKYAKYSGSGDVADAANFNCTDP